MASNDRYDEIMKRHQTQENNESTSVTPSTQKQREEQIQSWRDSAPTHTSRSVLGRRTDFYHDLSTNSTPSRISPEFRKRRFGINRSDIHENDESN